MSQLLRVRFPHGTKMTPCQRDALSSSMISGDPEFDSDGTLRNSYSSIIIDLEGLRQVGAIGAEILEVIDNDATKRLVEFGQRSTTVVNERCSVAVAGLGTLTVSEVKHVVDCCTDALQRELDDGWRILAVCVQPDQRRPDYILGRTRERE